MFNKASIIKSNGVILGGAAAKENVSNVKIGHEDTSKGINSIIGNNDFRIIGEVTTSTPKRTSSGLLDQMRFSQKT